MAHYVGRGYAGKAMVVSINKKTAVRMYVKVKEEFERYLAKLRISLGKATNDLEKRRLEKLIAKHEGTDMAVVVSQGQNEIDDLKQFGIDMRPIRKRMIDEDLEEKFKDENDSLRIVFVCAMWITGFDVPNLSTLYLDKPLKNHTLMQTIARANRVHPGKKSGLIVDYIGVFRNLQKALSVYASTKKDGEVENIIKDKEELVAETAEAISIAEDFLNEKGLDLNELLNAENEEKIKLVDTFTNEILEKIEYKDDFLNLAGEASSLYQAILPDPKAEEFYKKITALRVISSRIREIVDESTDVSQVKKDLEDLLDESIKAGEYKIKDLPKLVDLSKVDFDGLREFFEKDEDKNIVVEKLSAELESKIKDMVRKNKIRKRFLDRLNLLLKDYNSGSMNIDEFFDQLVELANDLSDEDQRAVKQGLDEEELAVLDLLLKDGLNPDEVLQVKKVAQELLGKLKDEKLVLDWKKRQETQADVKVTIRDILYDNLPSPYTEDDCEDRSKKVYYHIYDSYVDNEESVYSRN